MFDNVTMYQCNDRGRMGDLSEVLSSKWSSGEVQLIRLMATGQIPIIPLISCARFSGVDMRLAERLASADLVELDLET
jgi:hypothetical protein